MYYSTFFGLELGKKALDVQQLALNTTAHNIANANTPGYSRQMVNLATTTPYTLPGPNRMQLPAQLGTGVMVEYIARARDIFLDRQIRNEAGDLGAHQAQTDYYTQIENIVNEPSDQSVGQALDSFWSAWHELSVYPEDAAVRNTLISSGQQLTYMLQTKDSALQSLQANADQEVRTKIGQINQLGSQLRDINIRINQSVGVEATPNDLMDTRDKLLEQLGKLTNFEGHQMPNGLYDITISGHTLVQDAIFIPLTVTDDPANTNYAYATWSDDGSTAAITSGEIKGLTDMRDVTVPGYRKALNDLALGLMAGVNPVHAAGYALNAAAPSGLDFFTGTGVQDLQVNPTLVASSNQIAAATNPTAPGDGSNALALAQLQTSLTMSGNTLTYGTFYQGLVAQVGMDSQQNQLNQDSTQTLVDSLTKQRESVSGVNLDEEMTNMMKYQDGYQAAIRVISTVDSMLDTLINHMGAGR